LQTKRSRVTFEVRVNSWQKTSGNFVEFKIEIQYLEGAKQKWEIYRRFSDFQELSHLLQEYFNTLKKSDPRIRTPAVPPKVA
jgi:hypothetical protein